MVTTALAEVVARPGGQAGRAAADKEELRQAIESEYSAFSICDWHSNSRTLNVVFLPLTAADR